MALFTMSVYDADGAVLATQTCTSNHARQSQRAPYLQRKLDALIATCKPGGVKATISSEYNHVDNFKIVNGRSHYVFPQ